MDLATCVTKNGTTGSSTQDLTLKECGMIGRLAGIRRSDQKMGLDVRWKMGAWLNECLGPPTKEHSRWQFLSETIEETMGINLCDLIGLRWFAYCFKSVEEFVAKHPAVTSWHRVKEIVADLNAVGKGKARKRAKSCGNGASSAAAHGTGERSSSACNGTDDKKHDDSVVDGIFRSLNDATDKFRQNGFVLEGTKREQMLKAIAQLVEVVSDRLQIRLKIEPQEA